MIKANITAKAQPWGQDHGRTIEAKARTLDNKTKRIIEAKAYITASSKIENFHSTRCIIQYAELINTEYDYRCQD